MGHLESFEFKKKTAFQSNVYLWVVYLFNDGSSFLVGLRTCASFTALKKNMQINGCWWYVISALSAVNSSNTGIWSMFCWMYSGSTKYIGYRAHWQIAMKCIYNLNSCSSFNSPTSFSFDDYMVPNYLIVWLLGTVILRS